MQEQLAQIKAYLAAKHHRETVELTICTQPELIGGFVLETGDHGGRLQRPGADQEFRTKIDMEVMTWVP